MPPQKTRHPPREYFLKGRALANEISRNPECVLVEAESVDLVWVQYLTKLYTPVPVGTPMPITHPVVQLSVEFVFCRQLYSKQGNLKLPGPTTLDTFGSHVCEMAREARFPTISEVGKFTEKFDSKTNSFPGFDNRYLGYLDRAHNFLHKIGRSHELATFAMLAKNIRPSGLCNVRIGPSSLHGEGVFAQRNLKRGDLITLHPCHYISINIGKESAWVPANVKMPKMTLMLSKLLFQYSAKVEGTCLSVAADPTITASPAACAHLINDAATLETRDFGYHEMYRYVVDSTTSQNSYFVTLGGVSVAAVASRDIQRGEEIFTAYGAAFWANLLAQ